MNKEPFDFILDASLDDSSHEKIAQHVDTSPIEAPRDPLGSVDSRIAEDIGCCLQRSGCEHGQIVPGTVDRPDHDPAGGNPADRSSAQPQARRTKTGARLLLVPGAKG
jgi:hypothetical protein